jgi:hypothetical protein
MVHGGQPCPLSGAIEPATLIVPQGAIPVAPFPSGTGALEALGQLLGLLPELALLGRAQCGSPSTGLTQRRAPSLGHLSERLDSPYRTHLGNTLQRGCGHEMGMQRGGH